MPQHSTLPPALIPFLRLFLGSPLNLGRWVIDVLLRHEHSIVAYSHSSDPYLCSNTTREASLTSTENNMYPLVQPSIVRVQFDRYIMFIQ